jgi:hypothetical protein
MRVINYKTGETLFDFELNKEDLSIHAMVSLAEVFRQDPY